MNETDNTDIYIFGLNPVNGTITEIVEDFNPQKHIRILAIGNSYSADSFGYVPFILKNAGITSEIYILDRGSQSLDELVDEWEDRSYEVETRDGTMTTRKLCYIDTRKNSAWDMNGGFSAKDAVEMKQWDLITIQQWSGYAIDYTTYEPYTGQVLDLIRASCNYPVNIGWNEVCTRPANDEPANSINAARQNYKNEPFTAFLPYGTAIFNARENATLAALGDYDGSKGSSAHNLWSSDGVHLQDGIPRYIAALAICQAIYDKFFSGMSVWNDQTRPTAENIAIWSNPEQHLPSVGVSESNCYLAQKAAITANKYPFEIIVI